MNGEIELLPLWKELEYIPILHGKSGQLPLPRMQQKESCVRKTSQKGKDGRLAVVETIVLLLGAWATVSMVILL